MCFSLLVLPWFQQQLFYLFSLLFCKQRVPYYKFWIGVPAYVWIVKKKSFPCVRFCKSIKLTLLMFAIGSLYLMFAFTINWSSSTVIIRESSSCAWFSAPPYPWDANVALFHIGSILTHVKNGSWMASTFYGQPAFPPIIYRPFLLPQFWGWENKQCSQLFQQ